MTVSEYCPRTYLHHQIDEVPKTFFARVINQENLSVHIYSDDGLKGKYFD